MDLQKVRDGFYSANSSDHVKALEEHRMQQFQYDQEVQDIMLKKYKAQQTIAIKNYLYGYCKKQLPIALDGRLHKYPEQVPHHVGVALRGVVSSAHKKIYGLVVQFDTDDFKTKHMSPDDKGSDVENFWDEKHLMDQNNWRTLIEDEVVDIVESALQALDLVHSMLEENMNDFMMHPQNAEWFANDTEPDSKKQRFD